MSLRGFKHPSPAGYLEIRFDGVALPSSWAFDNQIVRPHFAKFYRGQHYNGFMGEGCVCLRTSLVLHANIARQRIDTSG